MTVIKTKNKQQTKRLAKKLAQSIIKNKAVNKKGALIITLEGELGSGKTTFAQGFIQAMGIKKPVRSPTFLIYKRYNIANKTKRFSIIHMDCYRLIKEKQLALDELKDIFTDKNAIILIEWPGRIKSLLPLSIIRIKFRHGRNPGERIINIYNKQKL